MQQTEQFANAAKAFVAAQRGFGPALKQSTNPAFRSRYSDLAACIEAVMDALGMNGLALMQVPRDCEAGVAVETLFIHESGEVMSGGIFRAPVVKSDPQGYGSATTYARRYGLMAACGIAPEDDDGNAASKPQQRQQGPQPPRQEPKPETLPPLSDDARGVVKLMLESWAAGDKDAVMRVCKDIPEAEKAGAVKHMKASAGGSEMLAYIGSQLKK